ncbi:MAG: arginine--tRNA ligase [Bdellovibrionales bacterium RBG_16_40_8]|nr:MAG: arginine--tRNA ligase [Bdellovibrionales bacterium RBG_16_40_8]
MLTTIIEDLAHEMAAEIGVPAEKVKNLFEIPKELSHGHLSIPVFFLAKERKKAPQILAKEISEKLLTRKIPSVERFESVGGYINIHLNDEHLFKALFNEVQAAGEHLGHNKRGAGKTVIIDYSSPNVAKPMHVGHLRATVIGQAIRNLAETQGYKVIGLNHLGDWGVQFGKLAYAYKLWSSEYPFAAEPFESLFKLYVRFHEEAAKDLELEKQGSLTFKELENGDKELLKLWKMFVEISLKDFSRLWARLGVKHDLVRGESFYNDRLNATEELIEKKGLLVESEGAMVVDLQDEKIPPCLIRKSDGASLYATRDLASAIYRMEELKADLNLYVVGADQALHFKQVFSVLRRLGYSWWDKCQHIGFGMYRFKDVGKMSSRKGQIVRLEDLLQRAVEIVQEIMHQKNPNLPNREKIAEQVAVGAIIFNDLVNDRVRDVEFDWDKALSFEGDSGPYLQYVHVRCQSILQKYGKGLPENVVALKSNEERELIKIIMRYEMVLIESFKNYKPSVLAIYLLDVCAAFNKFYHEHKIIGGEAEFESSRIALVYIAQQVIKGGLRVLNIQAPQAM